ncbi:hypothetical protein [Streptomyces sp. NPDC004528]|uniref:hypothetical protein n=1 Tax=Streptomyces sp. NPDC004528 TaxID=3154550 RepID=UPI0033A89483
MQVNEEYMAAVRQAPLGVIEPYLTSECTECDRVIDPSESGEHVMIGASVVIGCLGFFQIDPNVVGVSMPDWCDWRTPIAAEPVSGRLSLYEMGEALVKFVEGHDFYDLAYSRQHVGLFYGQKVAGAVITAVRTWLEAQYGALAVRAADFESMMMISDEAPGGHVPRMVWNDKTLSVGDQVHCEPDSDRPEALDGVITYINTTFWGQELCATGVGVRAAGSSKDVPVDWYTVTRAKP